jgi:hypothetical protein
MQWEYFCSVDSLVMESRRGVEAEMSSIDVLMPISSSICHTFIGTYFSDQILMSGGTAYAYDKPSHIWLSGSVANPIVIGLVDELNTRYREYIFARNLEVWAKQEAKITNRAHSLSEEEVAILRKKNKEACKKQNKKIKELIQLSIGSARTLMKDMGVMQLPHREESMEKYHNLVPMRDGVCIDLNTWEEKPMRADHYFTSLCNASLLDIGDAACVACNEWLREVCCFDEEYLAFMHLSNGFAMTLMNDPRAFYIWHGKMGRNGKSSLQFMFQRLLCTATPNRGLTIPPDFLTQAAQNKMSASGTNSVLAACEYKTWMGVEELRRGRKLASELIKSLTSGDKHSARRLFQEPVAFDVFGSLTASSNHEPEIDVTDAAIRARACVMPFRAEWVKEEELSARRQQAGLDAGNIHLMDAAFKHTKLANWVDAFMTLSLHAVYKYLLNQPRDPDDRSKPSVVAPPAYPSVVRNYTDQMFIKLNPARGFIIAHLAKIRGPQDKNALFEHVHLEFSQYVKNNNYTKSTSGSSNSFEEILSREGIELIKDVDKPPVLDGWYIKRNVPRFERSIQEGTTYQPPPPVVNDGFYANPGTY